MMPFRTPEMAFVAAACAWPRGPADLATLNRIAAGKPDWQLVARLARVHHVVALVADALASLPEAPPLRASLAAEAMPLLGIALRQAHETARLVALLGSHLIPTTVLKGAATAARAFGRPGLRQSIDIDLLVPQSQVSAASALLSGEGYVLEGDLQDALRRGHKDLLFHHPGTDTTLELHWRLFQNPRLLPVPAQTVPVEILPGRDVATLPPLEEAIYLCAHGGEHGWARLKWLVDLTALIRCGRIDAQELYETARRRRLTRMVGPGLVLAHRVHGTPLPPALERDMARDWRMRRLVDLSWQCLAGAEDGRELTEREGGTTLKNLSHYLFSADPRNLWHEMRYDLLDRPEGQGLLARIAGLATRLLIRKPAAGAPA
ncbi:nucleotidyltransferase domain-containing protein [Novosphingobium cyanobacteriorum]|uniref:Nucleotidyltransferase family protein n=1 Tax=Novosphingobium cyanobacteriorum TaxID=3024215 RepID=A0ABT6CEW4_9SPHN|nr:nucleotidyltransferase family protein [Novosphingobium cyanobacteriorum]MDF8332459.1 nucleotidyltransferase family protein [Novosphingobium cyanobacteriorum]